MEKEDTVHKPSEAFVKYMITKAAATPERGQAVYQANTTFRANHISASTKQWNTHPILNIRTDKYATNIG